MVGTPSRMSLRGGRPFQMSGSCRVALLDVREWSGGHHGCPGVVGRLSRMSGSGGMPPDVREWSDSTPGWPGVVVRPSRISGSGQDALPNDRE